MNCFEAIATKEHKAIHQAQLGFHRGDTILVFETAPTGWWRGEIYGKKGLFPQSYVTWNKELYGEDPLGTSTSSLQQQSQSQSQQQSQSPKISLSPPLQSTTQPPTTTTSTTTQIPQVNVVQKQRPKSTEIDNIDDAFEEIDRIIQSTSPHSISPPEMSPAGAKKKPTTTMAPPPTTTRQQYNTMSGQHLSSSSPPLLKIPPTTANSTSTNDSLKKSPRLNINKEQMLHSEQPGDVKFHSRKVSGPSGPVEETDSNKEFNHGASASDLSSRIHHHPTSAIDAAGNDEATKYRTLPSSTGSSNKPRKPLSNITRATGRISINDVNLEQPTYITKVVEAYGRLAYEELSLNVDDLVVVYNAKDINGEWWVGKLKNNYGIFPKRCVEIIKDISATFRQSPQSTSSNNSSSSNSLRSTPERMSPAHTRRPFSIHLSSGDLSSSLSQMQQQQQQQLQPPSPKSTTPSASPRSPSVASEEAAIAEKIKASFSLFNSKEEMLDAMGALAIKFVRQTNLLKQELEQERTLRAAFEKELIAVKKNQSSSSD
ncbi:hypothetical protein SAMD00019534_123220, partial [Acytostelium subglobosum LB1]|uniref:hypothetical protein n=1 Tax=Acytostelium subglobosum LB1 TaxID=1410327 RepID=UPI000644C218